MPSSLISIHHLIGESWRAFLKRWNETLPIAAWTLLAPALMVLVTLLTHQKISGDNAAFLIAAFSVLNGVLLVWIIIRLTQWLLAAEKNQDTKASSIKSWSLFWPFIWLSILEGLIVLGGLLILVIPAIWLAIRIGFARFLLIDDGLRGVKALATSSDLVKGRWWPVFWRLVIPGLFFTILMSASISILSSIFSAIAGAAKVDLVFHFASGPDTSEPLTLSIWYLIQGIIQMLFLPLLLIWQVKLYQALKASR